MAKKPYVLPTVTVTAKRNRVPKVAPAPTYPGTPKPDSTRAGEPKTALGRLMKFRRGGYTKP